MTGLFLPALPIRRRQARPRPGRTMRSCIRISFACNAAAQTGDPMANPNPKNSRPDDTRHPVDDGEPNLSLIHI